MLAVTNNNDFDFVDRYDGKDFIIPAGQTIALDEYAARHFFGLGSEDKTAHLIRQGWMPTTADKPEAMKKLNNFSFDVVQELEPGAIVTVSTEQGSAPLQESEDDDVTDGTDDSSDSTPPRGPGRPRKTE